MGRNSSCDHLEVWRRAVFLFRKVSADKEGTFYKIGIDRCVIEHSLGKKKGESPDIIGWSSNSEEDHYLIGEVTCNPNPDDSKRDQLIGYLNIDPNSFRSIGIQSIESPIVVLLTRHYLEDYSDFPQIILSEKLDAKCLEKISWVKLKDSIQEDIGKDLTHLPELSFTLLPEFHFVRPHIVDSLMKMMTPRKDSFTAADVAEEAMESIYDVIDPIAKQETVDRIETEIKGLIKNQMKDYLSELDGAFSFTDKGKKARDNPKGREKIESILRSWAGIKQVRLDDFGDSTE
jgi:hypothetical protein